MNEFVYTIIGALFSAVIVWIIKGFFSQQKDEVKRIEDSFAKELKRVEDAQKERDASIDRKIEKIHDGHLHIYNDILDKFSKWEDRIKKVISEAPVIDNTEHTNFKKEILKSFDEFDKVVKRDVNEVRRDMEQIGDYVEKTSKIIDMLSIDSASKKDLKDALQLVFKIEKDKDEEILELESKLTKLFDVCKILNHDQRNLAHKFDKLYEIAKQRIKLID